MSSGALSGGRNAHLLVRVALALDRGLFLVVLTLRLDLLFLRLSAIECRLGRMVSLQAGRRVLLSLLHGLLLIPLGPSHLAGLLRRVVSIVWLEAVRLSLSTSCRDGGDVTPGGRMPIALQLGLDVVPVGVPAPTSGVASEEVVDVGGPGVHGLREVDQDVDELEEEEEHHLRGGQSLHSSAWPARGITHKDPEDPSETDDR